MLPKYKRYFSQLVALYKFLLPLFGLDQPSLPIEDPTEFHET